MQIVVCNDYLPALCYRFPNDRVEVIHAYWVNFYTE